MLKVPTRGVTKRSLIPKSTQIERNAKETSLSLQKGHHKPRVSDSLFKRRPQQVNTSATSSLHRPDVAQTARRTTWCCVGACCEPPGWSRGQDPRVICRPYMAHPHESSNTETRCFDTNIRSHSHSIMQLSAVVTPSISKTHQPAHQPIPGAVAWGVSPANMWPRAQLARCDRVRSSTPWASTCAAGSPSFRKCHLS